MIVRELITLLGFKVEDTGQKDYNKSIDETKGKQQSLTASILKANLIGKAAGAVLGGAFSFIKDSVIGTTAEIERYRVALGTMIGDQEKANEIIHNLDYSDVSDFYGTAAAIGGLKSMVTLGMEAQKASDVLTLLGDVAQGDGAAFQSLSQNMGQVFAKGKADAMDLKQFVAQGFDVSGEVAALDIAKQMGVNVTAIDRQSAAFQAQRNVVEKAGISYAQTEAALISITGAGGKYEGMLEKQSYTLGGIINKFRSLKAAIAEAIGTGVSEELKGILKYFLEAGKAGQDAFAGVFVKAIKTVIDFIWDIIVAIEDLKNKVEDAGNIFEPMIAFAHALYGAFHQALSGIFPFVQRLAMLLLAIGNNIALSLTPIIQEVGRIAEGVFGTMAQWLDPIITIAQNGGDSFKSMGEFAAGLVGPILAIVTAVIAWQKAMAAYHAITKAIVAVTKSWAVVQGVLNGAIALNPVGLIIAGVIALIAIIILLVKNWDKIVAAVKNAFRAVVDFFSNLWSNVTAIFGKIVDFVKEKAAALFDAFAEKFPSIAGVLRMVFDTIKKVFTGAVEVWKSVISGFINIWKSIFSSIVNVVKVIFNAIWNHIKVVFDSIKNVVMSVVNVFKTIFMTIFNVIKGVFTSILDFILNTFEGVIGIWSGGGSFFEKLWSSIKLIFTNAFDAIKNIAIIAFNGLIAIWESIGGVFGAIFDGVKNIVSSAWNGIVSVATTAGEGIVNVFSTAGEAVKNIWTAVSNFFGTIGEIIFGFFRFIVDGIKGIWNEIVAFFRKWGETILSVLSIIIFGIPAMIVVAVRQIIKHWSTIGPALKKVIDKAVGFVKAFGNTAANLFKALVQKVKSFFAPLMEFFSNLWNGIIAFAKSIWEGLGQWFGVFIETVKGIWGVIAEFFAGLWDGIMGIAKSVWGGLTEWFTGLIESIKAVWNGITSFFSGLWEALMQGPQAAIEYIRTAFTNLFDGIQEKLFGFINKVKEGWDKVTGFFGNAVTGVVNFFTGGEEDLKQTAPTKVNDMILTPEGQYQTSPDDYIMAMKDPGSLLDALMQFLGQGLGGMQPALAGAAGQGMVGSAMMQAAATPVNYNSSQVTINAQTSISVNVPRGTSQEQAKSITQQINDQFDARLLGVINSSRGNIPRPEIERY
jgi:phage-related protein